MPGALDGPVGEGGGGGRPVHPNGCVKRIATAVGGGGGIPCPTNHKSTNSGARSLCQFLKTSPQITYASRRWVVRIRGRLLLFPGGPWTGTVMHIDTGMYCSTSATSTGNELSLTESSGAVQVGKGRA